MHVAVNHIIMSLFIAYIIGLIALTYTILLSGARVARLLDKMPKVFKELYPKTVIIIDAVEFRMESPPPLDLQSACYSSDKGTTTMKGLVGISPLRVVSFLRTGILVAYLIRNLPSSVDYMNSFAIVMM